MNFNQAIDARSKGYKVKRKTWASGIYWDLEGFNGFVLDGISFLDMDAQDWEITYPATAFIGQKKFVHDSCEIMSKVHQDRLNKLQSENITVLNEKLDALEHSVIADFDEKIESFETIIGQNEQECVGRLRSLQDDISRLKNNNDFLLGQVNGLQERVGDLTNKTAKLTLDSNVTEGIIETSNILIDRLEEKFNKQHEQWAACVKKMNVLEDKINKESNNFRSYIMGFNSYNGSQNNSIKQIEARLLTLEEFSNAIAKKSLE